VRLPLGERGTAEERLSAAGLELREEEGRALVSSVRFGSPAGEAGISFDWEVLGAKLPQEQVNAYWLYLPAFALAGLVVMTQRRRVREGADPGTRPG